MVRLTAIWIEPLVLAQADLDAAAERHGTSLAACIDRLSARLGDKAVRRPVPHASHVPERAQRWQPPLEVVSGSQENFDFHGKLLKVLDKPESIAVLYATPDGLPRRFRWRGGLHEVTRRRPGTDRSRMVARTLYRAAARLLPDRGCAGSALLDLSSRHHRGWARRLAGMVHAGAVRLIQRIDRERQIRTARRPA